MAQYCHSFHIAVQRNSEFTWFTVDLVDLMLNPEDPENLLDLIEDLVDLMLNSEGQVC